MLRLVLIALACFLALFAALLSALVLIAWLQARRARGSLSLLACARCQKIIGADGARAALKEDRLRKRAMVAEASAEGLEIHIAPEWRFTCRSCGAPLVFDPDANSLLVGPHAHP